MRVTYISHRLSLQEHKERKEREETGREGTVEKGVRSRKKGKCCVLEKTKTKDYRKGYGPTVSEGITREDGSHLPGPPYQRTWGKRSRCKDGTNRL